MTNKVEAQTLIASSADSKVISLESTFTLKQKIALDPDSYVPPVTEEKVWQDNDPNKPVYVDPDDYEFLQQKPEEVAKVDNNETGDVADKYVAPSEISEDY